MISFIFLLNNVLFINAVVVAAVVVNGLYNDNFASKDDIAFFIMMLLWINDRNIFLLLLRWRD